MSLFGGSQPQAATQTVASGVAIQSSVYGSVVPVVFGVARITGNLIDYDDFQAIAVQNASAGGSGGSSNSGSQSYDYKAGFLFALCEGAISSINNVWASKSRTAFADSGLTLKAGAIGQSPYGVWSTKHPPKALSYPLTAYVCAAAYDLGSSAQLPNLSYEVAGFYADTVGSLLDADPADVVTAILTNPYWGVGYPSARLGSLSTFSGYCRSAGLVVSPAYNTQTDAASILNGLVQSCNSEFVWSGTQLTIVPYGDQDLSGNGSTYTAPAAALFSLTDDDFLDPGAINSVGPESNDPVQCTRSRPSDQLNSIRLEYLDRANNDYNPAVVEAKNQAAIEAYGLRSEQPEQAHQFCLKSAAMMSATLKLQRQSVRNVYTFTLGWKYCVLDPMDIVEITDEGLGLLNQWVRILTMEEDDNANIKVTAEEYLGGTGSAPLYAYQSSGPYIADHQIDPGNINTPMIFEPPSQMLAAMSKTVPQLMIGASGGADWGGCEVWISLDNATFKRIGVINAPARQGATTAGITSVADPDTTNTLSVDLSSSSGVLIAGSKSDADNFRTLCFLKSGSNVELVSFWHCSMTSANNYNLTYLRRGVFGTNITSHGSTSAFCRLDEAVASFDLPVTPINYAGQTLYLKFPSFNIFGQAIQDLSGLTAVTYVPSANSGSISVSQIALQNYGGTIAVNSPIMFSQTMPFDGDLTFTASIALSEAGTASVGKLSVKVNGTEIIHQPVTTSLPTSATVSNTITVAKGDVVLISAICTNVAGGGEFGFDGGTYSGQIIGS